MYKEIRRLLVGITRETNNRTKDKQESYIRAFNDRQTPKLIRE